MEESNSHEGEEALARRLIRSAGEFGADAMNKNSETLVGRGGEADSEKSSREPVDDAQLIGTNTVDLAVGDHQLETADIRLGNSESVPTATGAPAVEFVKVDKSLISLGFFTPSSRRIKDQKVKRISFIRVIDGKKVEATAEFHPSAVLGLPITADQDKFLALHNIITDLLQKNGKIANPIRFTSAQLLRLLNKRVRAGKNYRDISEWLDVMVATMIISEGIVWEAGKQKFARDRFHVFNRAVSVGREMPDGTIADANYVWLSDWQLENINQKFLLPIDLLTYRELKFHIAKALVPLLQVWLFASHRSGRDRYEKRYDELCEMLSIQVYPTLSQIRRQLKPSLDELVHYEYLKTWEIEKTSDGKVFKIVLFHGSKFHRDMRRRLNQKDQIESAVVARYEPDLPEAGRLDPTPITVPAAKPAKQPKTAPTQQLSESVPDAPLLTSTEPDVKESEFNPIDELSARGLVPSKVVKLLQSLPAGRVDKVQDYIDYWDSIPQDRRGTGLLYSLIQDGGPLPSSFETRRDREKKIAAQEHRQKLQAIKEELATAFEQYRDGAIDRFIGDELPPGEFERRAAARLKATAPQEGLWNRPEVLEQTARRAERRRIAEEMGTHRFLSYEDFCKRELPAILTSLGLTPAEFPELVQRTMSPSTPAKSTPVSS
jgi:hypothetical protein